MVIDTQNAVQIIKSHFALVKHLYGDKIDDIGKTDGFPEPDAGFARSMLQRYTREYWSEFKANPKVIIRIELT